MRATCPTHLILFALITLTILDIEHTVVPNAALWNVDFQWLRIVLLNVFACKDSSTREHYIYPRLSSQSKQVTTLREKQVRTCNNAVCCRCFYHAAFQQTELLPLISRPPLCWFVIHKEHNSTQPPIPPKIHCTSMRIVIKPRASEGACVLRSVPHCYYRKKKHSVRHVASIVTDEVTGKW
jgi:hypothetical protein